MQQTKPLSLLVSLLPILFLTVLLSLNVYYYGDDSLSGANQIALVLAAAFCALISDQKRF